jgi:hypothetical protein
MAPGSSWCWSNYCHQDLRQWTVGADEAGNSLLGLSLLLEILQPRTPGFRQHLPVYHLGGLLCPDVLPSPGYLALSPRAKPGLLEVLRGAWKCDCSRVFWDWASVHWCSPVLMLSCSSSRSHTCWELWLDGHSDLTGGPRS